MNRISGRLPHANADGRDFTGQKENRELGLLYYNARYYVPGIGRFASADTVVPDPANPQSFNRYSYGYNNPVNFTDPSGHCLQYLDNDEQDSFDACQQAWGQLVNFLVPMTPADGLNGLYDSFLMPLWESGITEQIEKLLDICGVKYQRQEETDIIDNDSNKTTIHPMLQAELEVVVQ